MFYKYWDNKYEELYINKFDNLDKMGKYLERQKQPMITQGEIDNYIALYLLKKLNLIFQQGNHESQMALLVKSAKHLRKK